MIQNDISVILASGSTYRKQLLKKLSIPFIIDSPDIDETSYPNENPLTLVRRLTIAKAKTVAARHDNALVIASDQIAVLEGKILGKPGTVKRACQQLEAQSGKTVKFMTGLCLWNSKTAHYEYTLDTCEIRFRQLSVSQIRNYIAKESPLDCAGSIKTEGHGVTLLEYMHVSDPNSLVGLPLIQLTTLLKKQGYDI